MVARSRAVWRGPIIRAPDGIWRAFRFEAAHRLPNVPPTHRCHRRARPFLGVEIQLEDPVDPRTGFVADFFDIEAAFGGLLGQLDRQCA